MKGWKKIVVSSLADVWLQVSRLRAKASGLGNGILLDFGKLYGFDLQLSRNVKKIENLVLVKSYSRI